ncbi:MAG: death on curing protein [Verrucomicrobiota bacterium]
MKPPKWLRTDVVLAMHDRLLFEHGGDTGFRDESLLESALARPKHLATCGKPSLSDLAAAYAFGIIKNHPFVDGNKRTGFMAAFVFLGLNGIDFEAAESEVVLKTLAAAANKLSEVAYAEWLQANARSPTRRRKKNHY